MSDSLLLAWFRWHYTDGLRRCSGAVLNFIEFGLHLFSVRELSRTLFAPWRGVKWRTESKAWFSSERLEAVWGNIISRTLGAIVRSAIIILGLAVTFWIAFWAGIVILLWLAAPLIVVGLFLFSLRLFF